MRWSVSLPIELLLIRDTSSYHLSSPSRRTRCEHSSTRCLIHHTTTPQTKKSTVCYHRCHRFQVLPSFTSTHHATLQCPSLLCRLRLECQEQLRFCAGRQQSRGSFRFPLWHRLGRILDLCCPRGPCRWMRLPKLQNRSRNRLRLPELWGGT